MFRSFGNQRYFRQSVTSGSSRTSLSRIQKSFLDDEQTAPQADNPYKETLARLERATIQVKDIAKNMLDKQRNDGEQLFQN